MQDMKIMKSLVAAMLLCLWGEIPKAMDVKHSFTQEPGAQERGLGWRRGLGDQQVTEQEPQDVI